MKFMQYTRKLGFEETPDYNWLRELFHQALEEANESNDGIYDWMLLERPSSSEMLSPKASNEKVPDQHKKRKIQRWWEKFKSIFSCNVA
jgi:casein kinase 1